MEKLKNMVLNYINGVRIWLFMNLRIRYCIDDMENVEEYIVEWSKVIEIIKKYLEKYHVKKISINLLTHNSK